MLRLRGETKDPAPYPGYAKVDRGAMYHHGKDVSIKQPQPNKWALPAGKKVLVAYATVLLQKS